MEECKYKKRITLDPYYKLNYSIINSLNKIALNGCKTMVFTRFPFYNSNKNSKELALKANEGNCVSFSYYVKQLLRRRGLRGYLIGAKPPDLFFRDGYNEISHCAVIVAFNQGYILFDTSFYFRRAVIVYMNNKHNKTYRFINVYSEGYDTWDFKYHDHTIRIFINGIDSGGYYKLHEISNPHECITLHTNSNDKRIFRCEINKKTFISSFYYKIDLYDNTLTLSINNVLVSKIDLSKFYVNNIYNNTLLTYWLVTNKKNLSTAQYKKIYDDVSKFLMSI